MTEYVVKIGFWLRAYDGFTIEAIRCRSDREGQDGGEDGHGVLNSSRAHRDRGATRRCHRLHRPHHTGWPRYCARGRPVRRRPRPRPRKSHNRRLDRREWPAGANPVGFAAERGCPMSIPDHARTNFQTLLRAVADGNLALMECADARPPKPGTSSPRSLTMAAITSSRPSAISPTAIPTTPTCRRPYPCRLGLRPDPVAAFPVWAPRRAGQWASRSRFDLRSCVTRAA